MKTGKICIFEDDPNGHRLAYLEILINYIYKRTRRRSLLLISKEVLDSKQYQVFLKNIESKFEIIHLQGVKRTNIFLRYLRFKKSLNELQKRGAENLIIPSADGLAQMTGLAEIIGFKLSKSMKIRCGLLRLGIAYPDRSFFLRIKHLISYWLQQKAPMEVFYYDDYAVDFLKHEKNIFLKSLPDPLLSWNAVKGKRGSKVAARKSKEVCFGCLGGLDTRKGVDLLMDAFKRAKFLTPTRLLLAGEISDQGILLKAKSLQTELGKKRIVLLNEFLTKRKYFEALEKMDVVCLPYFKHIGPSGVFAQAAFANKTLIVSDYGWLGWEGRKYNKCSLVNVGKLDDLIKKMEENQKKYAKLKSKKGNYVPASSKIFSEILSSLK